MLVVRTPRALVPVIACLLAVVGLALWWSHPAGDDPGLGASGPDLDAGSPEGVGALVGSGVRDDVDEDVARISVEPDRQHGVGSARLLWVEGPGTREVRYLHQVDWTSVRAGSRFVAVEELLDREVARDAPPVTLVRLEPGATLTWAHHDAPGPLELPERRAGPSALVRVENPDGVPVAGAEVWLEGVLGRLQRRGDGLPFACGLRTDEQGVLELPRGPVPVILSVALGDRSDRWSGSLDQVDGLVLRPRAQGSFVGTLEGLPAHAGPARVTWRPEDARGSDGAAGVLADAGGHWRLPEIPTGRPGVLRLEVEPGAPFEVAVPALAAGETRAVPLRHEPAFPLLAEVQRVEDGSPVERALVEACWLREDGSGWTKVLAVQRDGLPAHFTDCAGGNVVCVARADGYTVRPSEGVQVPVADGMKVVLHAERQRSVTGRVHRAGEPVRDFTVVLRQDGERHAREVEFHDREDGSFTIEDAPVGALGLEAFTEELAPVSSASLVAGDDAGAVELEVGPPARVRGRVLDRASGEPVAGVELRPYLCERLQPVVPWGDADLATDAGGEFAGLRVAGLDGTLFLLREGYSTRGVPFAGLEPGNELDLGELFLDPKCWVEVRLAAAGAFDPTRWTVHCPRDPSIEGGSFDVEGRFRIGPVDQGRLHLELLGPDRTVIRAQRRIRVGQDNDLTLEVDRGRTVQVRFEGIEEAEVRGTWTLAGYTATGWQVSVLEGYDSSRSGPAFDALPAGPVTFQTLDATGDAIATGHADLPGQGDTTVVLHGHDPERRLRFVDGEGRPLAGKLVDVCVAQGGETEVVTVLLDGDGESPLPGGVGRSLQLVMQEDQASWAWSTPLDTADLDAGAHELVVLHGEPLRLRTTHRGTAAGEVEVALFLGHPAGRLQTGPTDRDGRVGDWWVNPTTAYLAVLDQPGWWGESHAFQVPLGGLERDVPVRRRVNLDVPVQVDGVPRVGLALELRCTDLAEDVADWLSAGRVSGSPVTGENGRLRLHGLPEGRYRARAEVDGELRRATFELDEHGVPGGVVRLE